MCVVSLKKAKRAINNLLTLKSLSAPRAPLAPTAYAHRWLRHAEATVYCNVLAGDEGSFF